jgi:hypothetical protein
MVNIEAIWIVGLTTFNGLDQLDLPLSHLFILVEISGEWFFYAGRRNTLAHSVPGLVLGFF